MKQAQIKYRSALISSPFVNKQRKGSQLNFHHHLAPIFPEPNLLASYICRSKIKTAHCLLEKYTENDFFNDSIDSIFRVSSFTPLFFLLLGHMYICIAEPKRNGEMRRREPHTHVDDNDVISLLVSLFANI
jgi:hypothetical protein